MLTQGTKVCRCCVNSVELSKLPKSPWERGLDLLLRHQPHRSAGDRNG